MDNNQETTEKYNDLYLETYKSNKNGNNEQIGNKNIWIIT